MVKYIHAYRLNPDEKNNPFANLNKLSTGMLQSQAAAYLESGSYKLTQEIYKILLKRENKPSYRQGLAKCYLQRSLLAAEQEKYKEAITLWDNYAEYDHTHSSNEQYFCWLYITGQKAKIKSYLLSLAATDLEQEFPQLAFYLGYFHLAGSIDLLQSLPETTAFAKQAQYAQLALSALQANDLETMRQQLAKIPFRSAFRDLRTLLTAAYMIIESPHECLTLLAKIAPESPYFASSQLFAVLSLTGQKLTDALLTLSHKQQQHICQAKDWTNQQIKLLQTISRQRQLTDKIKFDLAVQYQNLLGADYSQRFCLALLPAYPAGKRIYEKNFGTLNAFETLRISALRAEAKQNTFEAIDYWDQCLELLYQDKQHNALKIAFIYRQMAKLASHDEGIKYLIDSLEFDAEDRETHLQVLKYYEVAADKKYFKERLQETLAQFPKDIEFLAIAMHSAFTDKAFKKATQFADKILAIDPVNTQAKHVLFSSHLNHARKLLKTKKFHLVEKEISHAEKLNLGKHYPILTQLLTGFFVYLSDDKTKGVELLEQSRSTASEGEFLSRYRITSEALQLDIPLKALLKSISPIPKNYALANTELNTLLNLLDEQYKADPAVMVKALDTVKKELKAIIKKQPISQEQLLSLMQRLERIKHFELMLHCYKCAPEKKFKPVWIYYKIYIAAKGNPALVPTMSISVLQLQHNTATDQGDLRTATLIANFLDKIHFYHSEDFYYDDEDEDDFYDPFAELFDHIDARTLAKINRQFDQFNEKLSEDKLVKMLAEMLPNKKHILLLFKHLEVFNALLFLRAAEELNIDINVKAKDIIDISQQEFDTALPFPF